MSRQPNHSSTGAGASFALVYDFRLRLCTQKITNLYHKSVMSALTPGRPPPENKSVTFLPKKPSYLGVEHLFRYPAVSSRQPLRTTRASRVFHKRFASSATLGVIEWPIQNPWT
jgi:hypothetical protein